MNRDVAKAQNPWDGLPKIDSCSLFNFGTSDITFQKWKTAKRQRSVVFQDAQCWEYQFPWDKQILKLGYPSEWEIGVLTPIGQWVQLDKPARLSDSLFLNGETVMLSGSCVCLSVTCSQVPQPTCIVSCEANLLVHCAAGAADYSEQLPFTFLHLFLHWDWPHCTYCSTTKTLTVLHCRNTDPFTISVKLRALTYDLIHWPHSQIHWCFDWIQSGEHKLMSLMHWFRA